MNEFARFLRHNAVGIFLGLCLGIGTTIIERLTNSDPLVLTLIIVSALLATALIFIGRDWQIKKKRKLIGKQYAFNKTRKGVIFTLGLRSADAGSVAYEVLDRMRPEYVGFLGTSQTRDAKIVESLVEHFGISEDKFKSETWELLDVAEGELKTTLVIDWMLKQGIASSDIVLDVTGGTVTTSISAFIAAQKRRIDTQYIYSEFDRQANRVVDGSQKPILVTEYI